MIYLGFDTSNYTTSAAVFDTDTGKMYRAGKLLPVGPGELGVRQSDALFHHTVQLPEITETVMADVHENIRAVGVSSRPRNIEGSYMPCFLAGVTAAEIISSVNNIQIFKTSHQIGHILAALFSIDRLELINEPFYALHVSGGTTDMLLCTPDEDEKICCELVSASADLKAGQLIDRVGVMLGLQFPCGPELEKLAATASYNKKINVAKKDGNPCFSGIENLCKKMIETGEPKEEVARFVLEYIKTAILEMVNTHAKTETVVFAGGVMSNEIIKSYFDNKRFLFAAPGFSSDNAVGTAVYAYLKDNK
ncbi:MAG: peptidase M22 [Ruminococcus sp.]|jgi:N6-L-threonylcarbamoyladenine synthase|nr:peptidase M22 [Ruminococcus sp.]